MYFYLCLFCIVTWPLSVSVLIFLAFPCSCEFPRCVIINRNHKVYVLVLQPLREDVCVNCPDVSLATTARTHTPSGEVDY